MEFDVHDDYMTKRQVCDYLDIGTSTLDRWIAGRIFPGPTCKKGPYRNSLNLWPTLQVVRWKQDMREKFPYMVPANRRPANDNTPPVANDNQPPTLCATCPLKRDRNT
jgi:hypothetical protein